MPHALQRFIHKNCRFKAKPTARSRLSRSRRSGKMPERRTSANSLRALQRQDHNSAQMKQILSEKFEDFA
ncbi:hypothetical protein SynPROS91_00498 [Synechococcus sp. PROS-9-1]|nr:hypothetical protein SynPROS91_00498 [Synechococcus sp. PROS-9-1]